MRINKQTRQDRRRPGPEPRPAWAGGELMMVFLLTGIAWQIISNY